MKRKSRTFCLAAKEFALLCLIASLNIGLISSAYGQTIKEGDILSLKLAIEIALRNHPTLETQQSQVVAADARAGQAWGELYPRLNIGGAYTRISPVDTGTSNTTSNAGIPPGSSNIPTGSAGTYNQYAASGTMSMTLFDFGKTWAGIQAQRLGAQAARHDLQATRAQVIEGVRESYYSLLSAEMAKNVAAEKIRQFQKHFEYARNLYSVGEKSKLDMMKAEVDLSKAKVDMIKADNAVKYYRLSLNNAMGLPRAPAYFIENNLSYEPPGLTIETALENAYRNRGDLLSLHKQMESAEQSLKVAWRSHYPVISGSANYMYVGTDTPLDHGWTAGVTVSVPIFNGFSTQYKVLELQANLKTINARIKELKQKIALELEQEFLAMRESDERRLGAEVLVRQSKENLDLANERYAAGLAINVEVVDAIYMYANAQFSHISAQYDHKIALARLEKAMGRQIDYSGKE